MRLLRANPRHSTLAAWGRKPGPSDACVLMLLIYSIAFLHRAACIQAPRRPIGGHWRCGVERLDEKRR